MIVRNYRDSDFEAFSELVIRYFRDDLQIDMSEEQLFRIAVKMQGANSLGQHWLLVVVDDSENDEADEPEGGKLYGFMEFQVDHAAMDWNYRPGQGFIRECFVRPEERNRGLAGLMLQAAEQRFRQLGISQLYLTCDDACHIWERLGFRNSGEVCDINEGKIYTKP